jgi:hypothetical protein
MNAIAQVQVVHAGSNIRQQCQHVSLQVSRRAWCKLRRMASMQTVRAGSNMRQKHQHVACRKSKTCKGHIVAVGGGGVARTGGWGGGGGTWPDAGGGGSLFRGAPITTGP